MTVSALSSQLLLRRVAAIFPDPPADPAVRLADDSDRHVRFCPGRRPGQLAVPDPRVRDAAVADALLPTDMLARLLIEPDRPKAAASSTALTAEDLHDLLARAGMPK